MKLERWALVADIIGAVAILVSLVFVGLQLRLPNSLAATDAPKEGAEVWTDAMWLLGDSQVPVLSGRERETPLPVFLID